MGAVFNFDAHPFGKLPDAASLQGLWSRLHAAETIGAELERMKRIEAWGLLVSAAWMVLQAWKTFETGPSIAGGGCLLAAVCFARVGWRWAFRP